MAARISYTVTGQTTATLSVVELNTTTTYAEVYITVNGRTSSNLAKSSISSSSNSWNVTGLSPGTQYYAGWRIKSKGGSTDSGGTYFTTQAAPKPPSAPSFVSAVASTLTSGRVSLEWGAVSGATSYAITVRIGSPYGSYVTNTTSYSNFTSITGLSEYTTYAFMVAATNANGTSDYTTTLETTYDLTAPNIYITGSSGLGSIDLSWTANDSGSGLANYNRYRVYIGTKDGSESSLTPTTYTNSSYYSWTSDANGRGLIANAYYWVGVRAYDNEGNSKVVTRQVQYRLARPSNWNWDTPKYSGSNINLTASEWNNFTSKINEFRLYKGYNTYSFSTVYKGSTIYASQINEAITAMRAFANVPSNQVSGGNATAGVINNLRNYLNAVY